MIRQQSNTNCKIGCNKEPIIRHTVFITLLYTLTKSLLFHYIHYISNYSGDAVKRINKFSEFKSVNILCLPYFPKFWHCYYRFGKAFPMIPNFSIYHISLIKAK